MTRNLAALEMQIYSQQKFTFCVQSVRKEEDFASYFNYVVVLIEEMLTSSVMMRVRVSKRGVRAVPRNVRKVTRLDEMMF